MSKRIDLIGKKFFRLKVIAYAGMNKHDMVLWKCICNCGKYIVTEGASLRNKKTKSCGCLHRDVLIKRNKLNTKHGFKIKSSGIKSNFYQVWSGFMSRCYNSNMQSYKNYGERGIKVSNRWLKFENFRDDMWKSYLAHIKEFGHKNTSLGRLDNNADYKKSNCKWETWTEQANNRRTIKQILDVICVSCHNKLKKLQLIKIQ